MSSPSALRVAPEEGTAPLQCSGQMPHDGGGEGKEVVCCGERREPREERWVAVGEGKEVVCAGVSKILSHVYIREHTPHGDIVVS